MCFFTMARFFRIVQDLESLRTLLYKEHVNDISKIFLRRALCCNVYFDVYLTDDNTYF